MTNTKNMKGKPLKYLLERDHTACLRFTPTAWAKLLCLRDVGDHEVGGFGLSDPADLLLVQDILLVRQEVSSVTVAFDDAAVADLFEDLVEEGHHPEQFARLWIHTHPGSSPLPSSTDEETFNRVFGTCHWAVMFVMARTGQTYARLRFGVGPGGEMEIPVEVDYAQPFDASDHAQWQKQYQDSVRVVELMPQLVKEGPQGPFGATRRTHGFIEDYSFSELGDLEPWEREMLLANTAGHKGPTADAEGGFGL